MCIRDSYYSLVIFKVKIYFFSIEVFTHHEPTKKQALLTYVITLLRHPIRCSEADITHVLYVERSINTFNSNSILWLRVIREKHSNVSHLILFQDENCGKYLQVLVGIVLW